MHLRSPILISAAALAWPSAAIAFGGLPELRTETYVSGLSAPVEFLQDPSDPSIQYVVQQFGRIRVIQDGVLLPTDFLNLAGSISTNHSERGLLGMALPPDYETDGRFYVNFTNPSGDTIIARFERSDANPLVADPNSREDLIFVDQPFPNHNGGTLRFGPDGMLYMGLGDGGNAGDPGHRAQNPSTLLGKMLRIDVSPQNGYVIPADNPFIDDDPVDALEEIWSFGLRNPWKFSFDVSALGPGATGAIVTADVGQDAWEEVNYEPAGAGGRNYGWRNKEGLANFNNSLPPAYQPLTDPIQVYSHGVGRSISGGNVYRGTKLGSAYQGRYFYADFIFRRVWSVGLSIDGNGEATVTDTVEHTVDLGGGNVLGNVAGFNTDSQDELYIINYSAGRILRVLPEDNTALVDFDVTFGTLTNGNLNSLLDSDDTKMAIQSEFGFSAFEPNLTELQVGAETSVADPIRLDVTIESKVDQPNGTGKLRVFNYDTNLYENVGPSFPVGTNDQVDKFEFIADPAAKVRDADGRVEVRYKNVIIATFSLAGFKARIDQVKIEVF